jgi:hypothetical protein
VEPDRGMVRVIIRDKWYALKLKHRREYVEKFESLR